MKKRMIKAWFKKKLGIISPSYCYRTGYLYEYDELKSRKNKKTNYEVIKNMSVDELARLIFNTSSGCAMCSNGIYSVRFGRYKCKDLHANCIEHIKLWLESEVE